MGSKAHILYMYREQFQWDWSWIFIKFMLWYIQESTLTACSMQPLQTSQRNNKRELNDSFNSKQSTQHHIAVKAQLTAKWMRTLIHIIYQALERWRIYMYMYMQLQKLWFLVFCVKFQVQLSIVGLQIEMLLSTAQVTNTCMSPGNKGLFALNCTCSWIYYNVIYLYWNRKG